jgi:hypothetical protein
MFVQNLFGAFSNFYLAGRTIRACLADLRDEETSLARLSRVV